MAETAIKLAVVICSVGRPECIAELMPALSAQTRQPDRLILSVTKPEDVGFDPATSPVAGTEVIYAEKGLPRQRNAGLDAVQNDCDIVVFFDDDFVPSRFALAGIEHAFGLWPEVNGMTGYLIADGINAPGLTDAEAQRLVAEYDAKTPAAGQDRPPLVIRAGLEGLYGCNMAYRMAAIGDARFDTELPLYGWQEDIDFAARISGGRVKTDAFAGVHRGAKSGRETSGRRLGYSQLANTWYLVRKGTMTPKFAARLAMRNFAANHAKILSPEPWIDRRGRAAGNWLALGDILTGRAHPGRILEL
ncbi:glycosyltransferase family 2 protein [Alloyangia pacifica]|uniref:glycosyltransferase family 2 protein n=1 Tax=Alloyangia pacifica TaxID=311180 RepID=UPI001CD401F8|nr:family 2 glycosyl transferase [Alloyangia pacifica]MCA0994792.1 family 2 glycosyl transferase [Alloyangia pacifica]